MRAGRVLFLMTFSVLPACAAVIDFADHRPTDEGVLAVDSSTNDSSNASNPPDSSVADARPSDALGSETGRRYAVSGRVTGLLPDEQVVVQVGSEARTVTGEGSFAFPSQLADGQSFAVGVTGPEGLSCSSAGSTKVEGKDVDDVVITCSDVEARLASLSISTFDDSPALEMVQSGDHDYEVGVPAADVWFDSSMFLKLKAASTYSKGAIRVYGDVLQTERGTGSVDMLTYMRSRGPHRIVVETFSRRDAGMKFNVALNVFAEQTLTASPSEAGAGFGSTVALVGDVLLVGAPNASNGAGAIYVLRRERLRGTWQQEAHFTGTPSSHLGTAVALKEGLAIASGVNNDVHLYRRTNAWAPAGSIVGSRTHAGARFGASLLVRNQLIVGSPGESASRGAVYVFDGQGDNWHETQRLEPAQPIADARFGDALTFDATIPNGADWHLVIGAPGEPSGAIAGAGAAYVFASTAGVSWAQQGVLKPASPIANGQFGAVIASGAEIAVASVTAETVSMFVKGAPFLPTDVIASPYPMNSGYGASLLGSLTWAPTQVEGVFRPIIGVGAPLSSAGRVHHFAGPHSNDYTPSAAEPGARAGSALSFYPHSSLSSQTYPQGTIAIGAPGKNNGAGAVYVR